MCNQSPEECSKRACHTLVSKAHGQGRMQNERNYSEKKIDLQSSRGKRIGIAHGGQKVFKKAEETPIVSLVETGLVSTVYKGQLEKLFLKSGGTVTEPKSSLNKSETLP